MPTGTIILIISIVIILIIAYVACLIVRKRNDNLGCIRRAQGRFI